jgi:dTDP-4-dehydrorhamnose reductase
MSGFSMHKIAPLLILGQRGQVATDLAAIALKHDLKFHALGSHALDLRAVSQLSERLKHVFDTLRPRAVINAAAYTAVDQAEQEVDAAFALNRDAPRHIAHICAQYKIPLIHISTDQVFDGKKIKAYTEADTPNPLCLYGRSKYEGECAVLSAYPEALIVRVSWVFGPSGQHFITKALHWLRTIPVIKIVSDQRARPTYSPDLSAALLHLCALQCAAQDAASLVKNAQYPSGLLHLAGNTVMSRYEQTLEIANFLKAREQKEQNLSSSVSVEKKIARILPVLTRDFPTPAMRPLNAELDCSMVLEKYGLQLGDFSADLERTLSVLLG